MDLENAEGKQAAKGRGDALNDASLGSCSLYRPERKVGRYQVEDLKCLHKAFEPRPPARQRRPYYMRDRFPTESGESRDKGQREAAPG